MFDSKTNNTISYHFVYCYYYCLNSFFFFSFVIRNVPENYGGRTSEKRFLQTKINSSGRSVRHTNLYTRSTATFRLDWLWQSINTENRAQSRCTRSSESSSCKHGVMTLSATRACTTTHKNITRFLHGVRCIYILARLHVTVSSFDVWRTAFFSVFFFFRSRRHNRFVLVSPR